MQAIRTFYFNSGETNLTGFDVDVRWNVNLNEYGKLRNSVGATYYRSRKGNNDDGEPLIDTAGYGFPAIRGNARIDWEYRDFAVGFQANYNKGYSVLRDPTIACSAAILQIQADCHVSANVTHDVSLLVERHQEPDVELRRAEHRRQASAGGCQRKAGQLHVSPVPQCLRDLRRDVQIQVTPSAGAAVAASAT